MGPPHHGRHRQARQSRNRPPQRQEGDARRHRKRPKDGLDSRSLGHFAGLRRILVRFVRYQKLQLENQQHSNQTTTTSKHLPEHQHSHGLRIPSSRTEFIPSKKKSTPSKNNNKPKRLDWLGHLFSLPFSVCKIISDFFQQQQPQQS